MYTVGCRDFLVLTSSAPFTSQCNHQARNSSIILLAWQASREKLILEVVDQMDVMSRYKMYTFFAIFTKCLINKM